MICFKLSFSKIGVDAADYTGYTFATARALIINQTCDYVMDLLADSAYGAIDEYYIIPYPDDMVVDMVQQIVTLPYRA